MTYRVGINGFGRIGRQVFKAIAEGGFEDLYEVVAINDLMKPAQIAHLLKYDTTYGRFEGTVKDYHNRIRVNDNDIRVFGQRNPADLPWAEQNIDLVIEASGLFTKAEEAEEHIDAGADKVIVTAPMKGEDITIVLGVNESLYDPLEHHVISNASCTTNCLAPVAKVLMNSFGIVRGVMTTVHSYTNDQVTLDGPHKDLRRARSAAGNIIPTTTGAAKALALVLPELAGKIDGFSLRVPTPAVSLIDFVVELEKPATVREINKAFKDAAASEELQGILGYSDAPLVSSDYLRDSRSAIVDSLSTMVVDKSLVKVVAWYDNEWGYSCRVAELAALVCEKGFDYPGDDDDDDDDDEDDES